MWFALRCRAHGKWHIQLNDIIRNKNYSFALRYYTNSVNADEMREFT